MPCRRMIALLLLVLYVPACTGWMEQSQPVPQVVAEKRPDEVRVYLRDGRRVDLREPRVEGDSLVGRERLAQAGTTRTPEWPRAAYALADIQRLETKETDSGKTWGLVLVTAAIGAAFVLAVGASPDWGE